MKVRLSIEYVVEGEDPEIESSATELISAEAPPCVESVMRATSRRRRGERRGGEGKREGGGGGRGRGGGGGGGGE